MGRLSFKFGKKGSLMKQYLSALEHILESGKDRDDRTGVGTRGVFGHQMRFDLRKNFPAITTKKLAWRSVVSELLWFLEGSTDERRLAEIHFGKNRKELTDKKTIWTANADKQGKALGYTNTNTVKELGPVYGSQWRSWTDKNQHVDQITEVLNSLKKNPYSRRHIVSAWNVGEVNKMALPPCHTMFQFHIQDKELSCQLYQRSCDMFLGVPFNIASYSLFTHMIATECSLDVGEFIHTLGDFHIYHEHLDAINIQLERELLKLPELEFNIKNIFNYSLNDFTLKNYKSHEAIKATMNV